MPLAMPRPVKRPDTSFHQFAQRIPADVKAKVRGLALAVPVGDAMARVVITAATTHVRVSLRTRDPKEAKARQGRALAHLEGIWQSVREGPRKLTHKETVALAGEIYREFVDAMEEDPGNPETWAGVEAANVAADEGRFGRAALSLEDDSAKRRMAMEERFGPWVDSKLAMLGFLVDDESRWRLIEQTRLAMRDAALDLLRNADGDYGPDTRTQRFPEWVPPKDRPHAPEAKRTAGKDKVSLRGLVDRWWTEAKAAGRSVSTHESYRATVNRLADFLGHDDARAVTNEDVLRFKDHRLAAGVSLKTIKDSDLAGLKAIFGYALANRSITENPALGIKVVRPQRIVERDTGFTPDEAVAILSQSISYQKGRRELAKTAAAKRWAPWLCAYTGARIGEIAQLRKQDVTFEDGHWVVAITPEAGTVKGKKVRRVALHPHLIEQGFPEFVRSVEAGHLFLNLAAGENYRGKWKALKNRLVEFVRVVVSDPRVQPNHAWRHLFTTICREVGIEDSIIQYIGGWTPSDVLGKTYGGKTPKAQANALQRFPRFVVRKDPGCSGPKNL